MRRIRVLDIEHNDAWWDLDVKLKRLRVSYHEKERELPQLWLQYDLNQKFMMESV